MPHLKNHGQPIGLILVLIATGCERGENERLAEMAEQQLVRQSEQNHQVAELQRQVAEGSRRLVEADAQSRAEMVTLQREVQSERTELGRQRDTLEEERRELASERRMAPVIAAAINHIGLLLICILPLILAWYVLERPQRPTDDQVVAEILLDDLLSDTPLLPPRPHSRAIGVSESAPHRNLPHVPDTPDETT